MTWCGWRITTEEQNRPTPVPQPSPQPVPQPAPQPDPVTLTVEEQQLPNLIDRERISHGLNPVQIHGNYLLTRFSPILPSCSVFAIRSILSHPPEKQHFAELRCQKGQDGQTADSGPAVQIKMNGIENRRQGRNIDHSQQQKEG